MLFKLLFHCWIKFWYKKREPTNPNYDGFFLWKCFSFLSFFILKIRFPFSYNLQKIKDIFWRNLIHQGSWTTFTKLRFSHYVTSLRHEAQGSVAKWIGVAKWSVKVLGVLIDEDDFDVELNFYKFLVFYRHLHNRISSLHLSSNMGKIYFALQWNFCIFFCKMTIYERTFEE